MNFLNKHRTGLLFLVLLVLVSVRLYMQLTLQMGESLSPLAMAVSVGTAALSLYLAALLNAYLVKWLSGLGRAYADQPDIWPQVKTSLFQLNYSILILKNAILMVLFDLPEKSPINIALDMLQYLAYAALAVWILQTQAPKISRKRRMLTGFIMFALPVSVNLIAAILNARFLQSLGGV